MSLIRLFSDYKDENGYPGTIQEDGTYDGGDTAAIMGTVNYFDYQEIVLSPPFDIDHGFIPIRHPDRSKWYGQPDRYSRDQLIPSLCTAIKYPGWQSSYMLYAAHKRRLFLTTWNTKGNGKMDMPWKFPDICGPEIWALWIRHKKPWWAHLVLNVLDLQTLIGAIQWRWFTPKTNQITRNHMLVSLVIKTYSPTMVGRLVYWINDWQDLTDRWKACNEATGEYPTWQYFKDAVGVP